MRGNRRFYGNSIQWLAIGAIVFLLSCWFGDRAAAAGQGQDTGLKRAQQFMDQGRYLDALDMYQIVVEQSQDDEIRAQAFYLIGQTYGFFLDQSAIALDYYQHVVEHYPGSRAAPDALVDRGIALFSQGKYAGAYDAFIDFLRRYPDSERVPAVVTWIEIIKPFLSLSRPPAPKPQPAVPLLPIKMPEMRVLIKGNIKAVTVHSNDGVEIFDPKTGQILFRGFRSVTFSADHGRLRIDGREVDRDECLVTTRSGMIGVGSRVYRGKCSLAAVGGELQVINIVSLEEYLYGVLPREMPTGWPRQALMAQAIAARTYALYMKNKNAGTAYDVVATTGSQVYGGYQAESAQTNLAVRATRGQIMVHAGRPIIACFHSNSGGYTEDPGNVWRAAFPYLKAKPDRFSNGAAGSTWEYFLSYAEVAKKLRKKGFPVGRVDQLRIRGKSRSGRTIKVDVVSDRGTTTLSSNQFRLTMGESKVKSTLFDTVPVRAGVVFKGRGYGHGVGMSQWGANRMARHGSTYEEILRFYYQDIEIVTIKG